MKSTSKQNLAVVASIALAFSVPTIIDAVGGFVHRQYVKMVIARPDEMLDYSREMTAGFQSLMKKAVDNGFQYADLPGFKANFIECNDKDVKPLHSTQISSDHVDVKLYCTLPVEKLALIRGKDGVISIYTTQKEGAITNGDAYTAGEGLYLNHFSAYSQHFHDDKAGVSSSRNDAILIGQLGFK
jgi:hypothetical protein